MRVQDLWHWGCWYVHAGRKREHLEIEAREVGRDPSSPWYGLLGRAERRFSDLNPPSRQNDWSGPDGKSDLACEGRSYEYPPPPDDE